MGTSHWNLTDPNGVRMIRETREAARDGGLIINNTNHRMKEPRLVAMAGDDRSV